MPSTDKTIKDEQVYRASAYGLLAALLRAAPGRELLDHLCRLTPSGERSDTLAEAMSELAAAARDADPERLEEEYSTLFIGIGKGEIVPYASWYLTGYLMEQPLGDLRDDLRELGFERSHDTCEPEDHAAAIFEVFSVMITDRFSLSVQQRFFDKHMKPWFGRFFADLGKTRSADFFVSVARFGAAYIELEQAYLSMRS